MSKAKPLTQAEIQALITSIPVYCSSTVFSVAGQTFTAAQAVALFTSVLNAGSAITATKAAWTAAIQAAEKSYAGDGAVAKEIRDAVALQFSNAPTTLSAFAIVPRKTPKPLSAVARAAATAKAKATRAARGTTSKKQKALISGNVTGVTITPTTSPEPASPAATPPAAPPPVTPAASSGAAAAATAPARA